MGKTGSEKDKEQPINIYWVRTLICLVGREAYLSLAFWPFDIRTVARFMGWPVSIS